VGQLVEALRYKPEGRGFDSRWCHRNFSLTILPALGLTQPPIEMNTRNISLGGGGGRPVRRDDNLVTFMCRWS